MKYGERINLNELTRVTQAIIMTLVIYLQNFARFLMSKMILNDVLKNQRVLDRNLAFAFTS